MDDLRRDLPLPHLTPSVSPRGARTGARSNRLGQTLAEARHDKRLELRDLAEITNIRTTHLEALEAGRYSELPEEVYSKNFVRLYAQAVGLDPARMLLLYNQERRSGGGSPPRETGLELPPEPTAPRFDDPRLGRLARMLLTLLLVVGTVLSGLWAFNHLLFTPSTTTPPATTAATTPVTPAAAPPEAPAGAPDAAPTVAAPVAEAAGAGEVTTPPPAATNTLILLSLRTTPPGAEVSIDGYRFGRTPMSDAPVRAGKRTVTLTRGGYRTFERTFDLSSDRRLSIDLTPTGSPRPAATGTRTGAAAAAGTPSQPPRAATGDPATTSTATVTVEVTAEAWLEVYSGGARGEGERLVYETAQPGSRYTFDAPVYLFSGNAGGVSVAHTTASGETETEALGAPGAVVGRAY